VQPRPASPPPLPAPSLPPTLTKRSFLPFVAHTAWFVDGQPAQPVKYYLVGGQRLASRTGSAGPVTYYDHAQLGSTVGSSGGEQTRYWPYGATRSGSVASTAYRFTGQRQDVAGLYFYQSRWYDSAIGRFMQPDLLIPDPGNPQDLNRYSYTRNNPLRYRDPSGHWVETAWDIANIAWDIAEIKREPSLLNWGALAVDVAAVVIPAVPGGAGLIARSSKAAKVAVEAGSHIDTARDAVRVADRVGAITTASRLRLVGTHSDEGAKLVKTLAEQSTHGSGSRVVIGKWVEGGGYIAEAQRNGGIYYETAEGVWDALGKDADMAWTVNEQFLSNQLKAGVSRIDLVGETISEVLTSSSRSRSFTAKELRFLMEEAANYGYELVGNSWIKAR